MFLHSLSHRTVVSHPFYVYDFSVNRYLESRILELIKCKQGVWTFVRCSSSALVLKYIIVKDLIVFVFRYVWAEWTIVLFTTIPRIICFWVGMIFGEENLRAERKLGASSHCNCEMNNWLNWWVSFGLVSFESYWFVHIPPNLDHIDPSLPPSRPYLRP